MSYLVVNTCYSDYEVLVGWRERKGDAVRLAAEQVDESTESTVWELVEGGDLVERTWIEQLEDMDARGQFGPGLDELTRWYEKWYDPASS